MWRAVDTVMPCLLVCADERFALSVEGVINDIDISWKKAKAKYRVKYNHIKSQGKVK